MAEIERVWVDIETTGLDESEDRILEIGIALTDRWGEELIAGESWLIFQEDAGYQHAMKRARADSYVNNMHDKSSLWHDLEYKDTLSLGVAGAAIVDWLDEHDVAVTRYPMCGNNVPFDRGFMRRWLPQVESHFHYRNVDVSTVKELCRDLNPRVFSFAPEKKEMHRSYPDILESITEYKFYVENFLWTEL